MKSLPILCTAQLFSIAICFMSQEHKNMMSFCTSKRWITTDVEIKNILKKCEQCWKSTLKGSLVLPYNDLRSISLQNNVQTFILNTNNTDDTNNATNDQSVGHWFFFSVNQKNKSAVLFDPLNNLQKHYPNALNHIKTYCKSKHFKLRILNMQTQTNLSKACGFHVIWMTHKYHDMNLREILQMKDIFLSNAPSTNELYVINEVLTVFSFSP